MTKVTEDHLQKACDLLNAENTLSPWLAMAHGDNTVVVASAKYIAEQEAAPKYPPELVEQAFELARYINGNLNDNGYLASGRPQLQVVSLAQAIRAKLLALRPDPLEPLDIILATGTVDEMADWLGDNAPAIRTALERSK